MARQNLFIWGAVRLLACTAFAIISSALLYVAIVTDNGDIGSRLSGAHIPKLAGDALVRWQLTATWIIGSAILIYAYLMTKEIFKRHNYDLETTNGDGGPKEAWRIWVWKIILNYSLIYFAIIGGSLLLVPVFHLNLIAQYLAFNRELLISFGILILATLIRIAEGTIEMWWKRKSNQKSAS